MSNGQALAELRTDGYVILRDILPDPVVEEARSVLRSLLDRQAWAKGSFSAIGPSVSTTFLPKLAPSTLLSPTRRSWSLFGVRSPSLRFRLSTRSRSIRARRLSFSIRTTRCFRSFGPTRL